MFLIHNFITQSAFEWATKEQEDNNSIAGFILRHIKTQGKLRDTQREALQIYLWLKCQTDNNPLIEVFKNHYPTTEGDGLTTLLVHIAQELENKKLEAFAKNANKAELENFFSDLFGGYNHISNILFSLPMGAGKTFVMASMIYIDLYFNLTNNDKRFAKNFLIFAPSGLKNSVIPSLRKIENFDPTWILPEDIARTIKNQMKFVVLDVKKNERKSNRIENPNARKVQDCLNAANSSNFVFVTNAEKVILDKVVEDPYKGTLFEIDSDEKSKLENELRSKLSQVPNLSILIDEVHHIQKDENKLRFVINNQFNKGNTINIIGFTGTPYFKRKISVGSQNLILDQIPSTVYHYELKNGVRNFLKQPVIKSFSSNTEIIVRSSLEDFYNKYYDKEFLDGRKPKLAIYCANIDRLDKEILPLVLDFYKSKGLNTNEIFWYYSSDSGNTKKDYPLPQNADIEFDKLDTPYSDKRIILLCQIGKEGWDCQSLAGVVLSGEGDSPKNMVLQTSCRCLREVDDAANELGLIYLNQDNYRHLEKELGDKHKITIKEFEEGKKENKSLLRIDRRKHLNLPPLEYKQLILEYKLHNNISDLNSETQLQELCKGIKRKEKPYFIPEVVATRKGLVVEDTSDVKYTVLTYERECLTFSAFLNIIYKSAFGLTTYQDLHNYKTLLFEIYSLITTNAFLKSGYSLPEIISSIHISMIPQSAIQIQETLQSESMSWIIADINQNPISPTAKIYPDNIDFINKIAYYDKKKTPIDVISADEDSKIKQLELTKETMSGDAQFVAKLDTKIEEFRRSKLPIKYKDSSFHYIPYDFTPSQFEKKILEHIFQLKEFQDNKLEVYFNGDRFLSTFTIKIYKRIHNQWKLIQNRYTPDFVLIKRNKKKIEKALIIETKGQHLAHNFGDIKEFMEDTFTNINQNKYDFLYLEDGHDIEYHLQAIADRINTHFTI